MDGVKKGVRASQSTVNESRKLREMMTRSEIKDVLRNMRITKIE